MDAYLERLALPDPNDSAKSGSDPSQLAAVLMLTNRLFPGGGNVSESFDPAWPDDKYVVVNVVATGDPDTIIQRQCEWHTQLAEILPAHADAFQLSIDVQA